MNSFTTPELGTFLRELRGNRSLREISKLTKLSHSYIRQLEIGNYQNGDPINPSVEVFQSLAKAYGVSTRALLDKANIVDEALSPEGAYFKEGSLTGDEYETLYLYQKLTISDQRMIKQFMRRLISE